MRRMTHACMPAKAYLNRIRRSDLCARGGLWSGSGMVKVAWEPQIRQTHQITHTWPQKNAPSTLANASKCAERHMRACLQKLTSIGFEEVIFVPEEVSSFLTVGLKMRCQYQMDRLVQIFRPNYFFVNDRSWLFDPRLCKPSKCCGHSYHRAFPVRRRFEGSRLIVTVYWRIGAGLKAHSSSHFSKAFKRGNESNYSYDVDKARGVPLVSVSWPLQDWGYTVQN
jgi:hypothetical protein